VTLPNSLLIGLARPSGKPWPPDLLHAARRRSVPQPASEPYRTQSLKLIRANIEHVDGFAAVSEYYAGYMCRYLGIPNA
jgi:hypothetical protein